MHGETVLARWKAGEVEVDRSEAVRAGPEIVQGAGAAAHVGIDAAIASIRAAHIVAATDAAQFGRDVEQARLADIVASVICAPIVIRHCQ